MLAIRLLFEANVSRRICRLNKSRVVGGNLARMWRISRPHEH